MRPLLFRITFRLRAPPVPTREPTLDGGRAIVKAVLTDHLPVTPVAKRVLEESGKDRHHQSGSGAPWNPSPRWSCERLLIALLSLAVGPLLTAACALVVGQDRRLERMPARATSAQRV